MCVAASRLASVLLNDSAFAVALGVKKTPEIMQLATAVYYIIVLNAAVITEGCVKLL